MLNASITEYHRCHQILQTLDKVYGVTTAASSSRLRNALQEIRAPATYQEAESMVLDIIMGNIRLEQATKKKMDDDDMRDLLFRKLAHPIFAGVFRRIIDKDKCTFSEAQAILKNDAEIYDLHHAGQKCQVQVEILKPSVQEMMMAGVVSKIDGNNRQFAMKCYNCNNEGHSERNCQVLYCHNCHQHWSSKSVDGYHTSNQCSNNGGESQKNDLTTISQISRVGMVDVIGRRRNILLGVNYHAVMCPIQLL